MTAVSRRLHLQVPPLGTAGHAPWRKGLMARSISLTPIAVLPNRWRVRFGPQMHIFSAVVLDDVKSAFPTSGFPVGNERLKVVGGSLSSELGR